MREARLLTTDGYDVVLAERLARPVEPGMTTSRGFFGVVSVVDVVTDVDTEVAWYEAELGWHPLERHRRSGPAIQAIVGSDDPVELDVVPVGPPGSVRGRVQLVCYHGVQSFNRHGEAGPGARGIIGLVVEAGARSLAGEPARQLLSTPGGLRLERWTNR